MIFRRRRAGEQPTPRPLIVPPFAPDPPSPGLVQVQVPPDPVAALAAHGVELPGPVTLEEGDGGAPWWATPVQPGYPAAHLWTAVHRVHRHTGLWPLLTASGTRSMVVGAPEVPEAGDGAAWLTREAAEILADLERGAPVAIEANDPDGFDWADALAATDTGLDHLVLVPAAAGWLVPGLLGWIGAVNADRLGDVHATLLRRWAGRWGAELVALEQAQMTLRVVNPPTDSDGAQEAAVEAALYCPDAVSEDTPTVEALMAALCLPLWRFWWD